MNRNALIIVAALLLVFGGMTVYFLRPIDESTHIEISDPPIVPQPSKSPPAKVDVAEAPTPPKEVPAVPPVPVDSKSSDLDLSAKGVRKYTPLPKPAFFNTDGMPTETQPINPLDFRPASPQLIATVKD